MHNGWGTAAFPEKTKYDLGASGAQIENVFTWHSVSQDYCVQ